MSMTLDPRWGFWFSIALAIVGATAGATTQMTDLFGAHAATKIISTCVWLLSVGAGINAVLHAIPSKQGAANEFPLGPKS